MIGGLHYVGYFQQLKSAPTTSIAWSWLIGYPMTFFIGSGICSRLLWDSIGMEYIADKEIVDKNYMILTTRLLEFFTGDTVKVLFWDLIEKYIQKKSEIEKK
jgi:hypothetical protein